MDKNSGHIGLKFACGFCNNSGLKNVRIEVSGSEIFNFFFERIPLGLHKRDLPLLVC